MNRIRSFILLAAGSFALAVTISTASAQATAPTFGATTPPIAITEQTLVTFVDAFIAVQEIHLEFEQQLQGVSDQAQAQVLQTEAQHNMVEAVEAIGMSVQEYNEIAMALQEDPELLGRVQALAGERLQ